MSADGGALLQRACPRCGGGFSCGAGSGHCDCFGLALSTRLQQRLAREHPGQCLCLRCLHELAAADAADLPGGAPAQDPAPPRARP